MKVDLLPVAWIQRLSGAERAHLYRTINALFDGLQLEPMDYELNHATGPVGIRASRSRPSQTNRPAAGQILQLP